MTKVSVQYKAFSETQTIRTLGLYQPYAGLMLHGKIETRWVRNDRKPPFPLGKYLLYSTLRGYAVKELYSVAGDQTQRILSMMGDPKIASDFTLLGHALCIGDLTHIGRSDQWPVHYSNDTFVDCHVADDEYTRWLLFFDNVKRIKPFTIRGKQGIGFLPKEDYSKIIFV